MAYQLIYESNPFLLSLIFFVFLYFRRCRENVFVRCLIIVNLFVFLSFELYFHSLSCRVSRRYYRENSFLVRRMINLFEEEKRVYWLDFGTLLNQLRHEPITPWDPDTDLSIIDPDSSLNSTNNLDVKSRGSITKNIQSLIDFIEKKEGFVVSYDSRRHYLQVWIDEMSLKREDGPHLDLWMWIPQLDKDGRTILLVSLDEQIHFNRRSEKEIFPLQRVQWLNQSTWIPKQSHQISFKEYQIYKGDYRQAKTFRTDCFHNLFNRRFNF